MGELRLCLTLTTDYLPGLEPGVKFITIQEPLSKKPKNFHLIQGIMYMLGRSRQISMICQFSDYELQILIELGFILMGQLRREHIPGLWDWIMFYHPDKRLISEWTLLLRLELLSREFWLAGITVLPLMA